MRPFALPALTVGLIIGCAGCGEPTAPEPDPVRLTVRGRVLSHPDSVPIEGVVVRLGWLGFDGLDYVYDTPQGRISAPLTRTDTKGEYRLSMSLACGSGWTGLHVVTPLETSPASSGSLPSVKCTSTEQVFDLLVRR